MMNRIIEHNDRGDYINVIDSDPTLFEMALFSYMSQLEEVDKSARVFIYKYEDDVIITSYRVKRDEYVTVNKSNISDSFSQYTLVDGDVEKSYESLFDIDIPSKKTILIIKHDYELILKVM